MAQLRHHKEALERLKNLEETNKMLTKKLSKTNKDLAKIKAVEEELRKVYT